MEKRRKNKTPYYFTRDDKDLMFLAGIYQNNQFCIITREATEKISKIHKREPVIINKNQISNYLNIKKEAMDILKSYSTTKPTNLGRGFDPVIGTGLMAKTSKDEE